jgi:hypothetical protein
MPSIYVTTVIFARRLFYNVLAGASPGTATKAWRATAKRGGISWGKGYKMEQEFGDVVNFLAEALRSF